MWVIFEGLDKAGKGTLEREFLKAVNYEHIVIDRGPVGYLTFDFIFNRETKERSMQYGINIGTMAAGKDFFVVYCKAPIDIIMQRLKEHNETCPYNYEFAQALYDDLIKSLYVKMGIKVLTVDTTKSIEECVKMIIEKLKEE